MAGAWAYLRVNEPSHTVVARLPELAGNDGARLVLKSAAGRPDGPPAGAIRFAGRWQSGRASGDAELLVMPLSSWGTELHVSVHSPGSLSSSFVWRQRQLARIAADLAVAVREACRRPADARLRQETANWWAPAPGVEGSAAR